ncbi:MAG: membrane protein insertion efficiency factor YidD [Verrucomicrobia bacterium]|nr:membrane protein insertion efficiency factor YidD [Verrucomicrobiota bacterium]
MSWLLIKLLRAYQIVVSPALHTLLPAASGCRFTPTCSQYAMDALRAHGAWRGLWLAARRLARCHPWGGHGFDPVPASDEARTTNRELAVTSHEFHGRLSRG